MASVRERNRNRVRQDIESAALELFEAQGYDNTTVEQITQLAAVSNATFFRYFGSKEEVLFADEQAAVEEMVSLVAERTDPARSVAALAEPVAEFARTFLDENGADRQRLTRLVMTSRTLEARSMRMRLRWEHAIARQLATESGSTEPTLDHIVTADVTVSCLAAALWAWQRDSADADIRETTLRAFERASKLIG